jgi:hypothetical protein
MYDQEILDRTYQYLIPVHALVTPKLLFDCARRTPECPPRIDAIWIELEHLVVELLRGCRHFGYPVEIADVLPCLFDNPTSVIPVYS